ncbi:MAG: hypothetical protein K2O81_02625 [Clostridia bacterium]|nr:hypothetical protein [Clostridia bacterium]
MGSTILIIVAVAVVVVLGVVGYFIVYPALRKKIFTCSKCRTHYDYDNDIEWTCTKEFTSVSGSEHRLNAEVRFNCRCPKCGEVKTFSNTFVIRKISYGDGTPSGKGYDKSYNLEELIKKYYQ